MNFPLYAKLTVGAGLLYWFLRYVYHELTIGAARRKTIKENGCKPVNRYPTLDPFFGLDLLFGVFRGMRQHNLLEKNASIFRKHGNTVYLKFLHMTATLTIEPEIVKTMLALKFKDFELGRESLEPLLGKGIFTTDGADWEVLTLYISCSLEKVSNVDSILEQCSVRISLVLRLVTCRRSKSM
jgi:hypothetical protein